MIKAVAGVMTLLIAGVAFAASRSAEAPHSNEIYVVDVPQNTNAVQPTPTSPWSSCAQEGQTCTVAGPTLVRYGVGDQVVIKEVTGRFSCGNDLFGDPAFGVVKSCSYLAAPASDDWISCASEDQMCVVPGSALVRYGASAKYAFKDATGKLKCSNDVFGDPIVGTVKNCAYRSSAPKQVAAQLPFGLYVGNPNGSDAGTMALFQSRWDASVQQLKRAPQFFGTFTDFSQDWSQWRSNASWFAWSFNQSGRGAGLKPVIGIKLSTNAYWNRQSDAFREIIAGKHDQVYRDVVAAWRDAGYKELRFRISYEFNGNFMPDNFGNDAATLDLWRKAFAHVADVMHAVPDVKVLVVWNPANINWSSNSVADAYPGDRYVDVISSDIYSSLYPFGLRDWSGAPDASSLVSWAGNPVNRMHFWDHPGGTQWTVDGDGWGMVQALNFAIQHKKPFAISETGVGGDNVKNGLSDDPQFPAYLKTRLAEFTAKGGVVDHVIIWDYDASDGAWRFSNVPSKAATAAAWTAFVK